MDTTPLVIHLGTQVTTTFAVCSPTDDFLFQQTWTETAQQFTDAEFERMIETMKKLRRMLKSGQIAGPMDSPTLPEEKPSDGE